MRLLKRKYNDEALVRATERALADVPTINMSQLSITSDEGVITLAGRTGTSLARQHALEATHKALQQGKLKHERIVDEMVVGRG